MTPGGPVILTEAMTSATLGLPSKKLWNCKLLRRLPFVHGVSPLTPGTGAGYEVDESHFPSRRSASRANLRRHLVVKVEAKRDAADSGFPRVGPAPLSADSGCPESLVERNRRGHLGYRPRGRLGEYLS